MKHWRAIIICIIISVIGFLLMSCAHFHYEPEPKMWQSKCAANTVLAIITVGQDHPTRGRCCKLGEKYHIQTEYKSDDEWIPLQVIRGDYNWPVVIEGKIENDGTKETKLHYMTGKEVMMEYWTRLKE